MITLFRATLLVIAMMAWGSVALAAAPSGVFLVASRMIRDPNFSRTVVLVTQMPNGAPVGVIINRPLKRRLSELFPEFEALKARRDVVYFGGPVARDGLVFAVRSREPPARGVHVLSDVYLTGDPAAVEKLLSAEHFTKSFRVYSGYSGWAPRQLKNEIERGDWYVLPADAETIFEKRANHIWPELITRATLRRTELRSLCDELRAGGLTAVFGKTAGYLENAGTCQTQTKTNKIDTIPRLMLFPAKF